MTRKKKNYARVCRIASRMCSNDNLMSLADYFHIQHGIYVNTNHVTQYTARELIALKLKEGGCYAN